MKWNAAVKQIEEALEEGKTVEIMYHRKYHTKISLFDVVESISEYTWHGLPEYGINTYRDQINDSWHIIDEVKVKEGE